MVEDRYYMRQTAYEPRQSATVILLVANAVAFLIQCFCYGYPPTPRFGDYFALSSLGIRQGYVWQLLTFQFMHANLWHLLGNCWVIFAFGRELEHFLGKSRFLALYFSSGLLGGLLQVTLGFLLPHSQFATSVVGASAGAFGLVAAFAFLHPEEPLTLLLFYVLPVSLRAKYVLLFSILLAVFGMVFPVGNMANAAHLGGIAGGMLFIHYVPKWNWQWRWPRFGRSRPTPARQPVKVRVEKQAGWGAAREVDQDRRGDDYVSREVDPILDKISAHGIHSLTEKERRILEDARNRMAKR